MSSQRGHAQSCIFWNTGIVRLKSPLCYAVVITLDVDKAKSMKLGRCHLPKYLSLKRQISQTSLEPCCSYCCEYVQGRFPLYWTGLVSGNYFIVPRLGGVSFYCSQVWGKKPAAVWMKQVWLHSVSSQQSSVSMGTAWKPTKISSGASEAAWWHH